MGFLARRRKNNQGLAAGFDFFTRLKRIFIIMFCFLERMNKLTRIIGSVIMAGALVGCSHNSIYERNEPFYKREGSFYKTYEHVPDLNMYYRIEYSKQ